MPIESRPEAKAPVDARSVAILGAILLVAAAVRAWRLSWGLADRMFFPDEQIIWGSYLQDFRSPTLDSLFGRSLNYPPLYGYVVGVVGGIAYALGVIGPGRDVSGALLVARSVSAAAGLATILLVWSLARRRFGALAGWFAAALLAVTPFEVIQTHYANTDILLGTWCALALLLACRLAEQGAPARALVAGAAAGLAFVTKWPGVAIAAAPAWAVLEVAYQRRSLWTFVALGAVASLGFALAAAVGCPPCLFETQRLEADLTWLRYLATSGWEPPNGFIAPSLGWYARPYLYQLVASLPFALGWPLYVAALAGVFLAARRHTVADRVILAGLVGYFFTMGRTSLSYPRYLLPLVPALVLFAGRALAELPSRRWIRPLCFAAVFAYSLAFTVSHVARFSYDQQKAVAQFVATALAAAGTLPGSARVAVPEKVHPYYALARPLASVGRKPQLVKDGAWFASRPEVFVLPEWLRISIERDRNSPERARDLEALDSGTAGYVEVARFESRYLDQELYTRLDPALGRDLFMGEIGFRVYFRKDLAQRLRTSS